MSGRLHCAAYFSLAALLHRLVLPSYFTELFHRIYLTDLSLGARL